MVEASSRSVAAGSVSCGQNLRCRPERRRERTANGIELDNRTWQQIVASARECSVPEELIENAVGK